MQKTKKELVERDVGRDIGAELLQSIRDVKAGKVGHVNVVKATAVEVALQRVGASSESTKNLKNQAGQR